MTTEPTPTQPRTCLRHRFALADPLNLLCFTAWVGSLIGFLVTSNWVWAVAFFGWQAATLCATQLWDNRRRSLSQPPHPQETT